MQYGIGPFRFISFVSIIMLLVACGGGGDSTPTGNGNPVPGGNTATTTPLDLSLNQGDFWEFIGVAESTSFAQPSTNNASVTVGRFRITLGPSQLISGTTAFPLEVTGDAGDFSSRWTHIAITSNGSLLGSTDGSSLQTIYNAETDQWTGGGFFVEFDATEQINFSTGIFPGNYNSLNALIAAHQQSTGGCELILGMTFCDDQSTTFSEREFYKAGIGPIGYALDATFSSSGGGFTTAFTRNTRIELIDSSFSATDGSVFNLPPWEEIAPLNTPRSGHSAVVLDGKIYVIGGADSNGLLTSVEIYDPLTNAWTPGVPLPSVVVAGVNASVINRKIYVATSATSLLVFDPDTSLWSEITPVNGSGSGILDTATYVDTNFGFGEIIVSAIGSPNIGFSGYAPASNEWLFASSQVFFTERLRHTIEVVGDSMFLLGGFGRIGIVGDQRGARDDITEYDIVNDMWITDSTLSGRMNLARDDLATTVLNDKIYIFGGTPVSCSTINPNNCARGNIYRQAEVYDPATRQSIDLPLMFQPREDFDAVVLDGRIYVIGGSDGDNFLAKVERFTP